MKRHIYDCRPGCPVASTLQIIAGKWKAVILYQLMQQPLAHFGELQRQMPACSRRMLALQLKELEQDGVIQKQVYPGLPPKTDYQLTAFGATLAPVIRSMETWGNAYNAREQKKTAN